MLSEKKVLLVLLAKAYNMAETKVIDLLYKKGEGDAPTDELVDDAESIVLKLNSDRVSALKAEKTAAFGEATGKTAEKFENWLRQEFGVDPDKKLQGDALVKAAKAAQLDQDTDPEKTKLLPQYRELETKFTEAQKAWEKQLADKEEQHKKDLGWFDRAASLKGRIRQMSNLNHDFITDPALALFVEKYKDYDMQPDGDDFILIRGGKRVENSQGHPITLFKSIEAEAPVYFPTKEQENIGQAGNTNGGGGGGNRSTTKAFADLADYNKQYKAAATIADKEALFAAAEKQGLV